jgi:prolyl-tRNA synthetase
MKASKMLISTLKEAPSEAKIPSHVLLLRAGLIKNEVAGIYNFLPMGYKVLRKIENIIREEMDNAGAQEIHCSALQPKELWVESGRWMKYGPELMRLKDRHDREFCLGPTHEEIFTSIARELIKSSKNLPLNIYQIQTKYRDELRPRFGLMRSREFIMKDAYSFDKDEQGLEESYQNMYDAYSKIFTRLGMNYQVVLADTGNIGGNGSHQFMALSTYGESEIAYCDSCNYAADTEKATSFVEGYKGNEDGEIEKIHTPAHSTIEELQEFLSEDAKNMSKTMVYHDFMNEKYVIAMVRADKDVNLIKLVNEINSNENYLRLATDEELASIGLVKGFIGPVGIDDKFEVLVDEELSVMTGFLTGANEKDYHFKNVKLGRDFKGKVCDIRLTKDGDLCPCCKKPLKFKEGIEVGQIFKLQTKYSSAMNCTYKDENGKDIPMVMGCYGIGVTRVMQAIVEQYRDDFGIKWPLNVAPYHAVIVPISAKDETQMALANQLHDELSKAGVEVILDDRDAKPGFKFKDWELIGIPFIITCGRDAQDGNVEFKVRDTLEKTVISKDEALSKVISAVKNI